MGSGSIYGGKKALDFEVSSDGWQSFPNAPASEIFGCEAEEGNRVVEITA